MWHLTVWRQGREFIEISPIDPSDTLPLQTAAPARGIFLRQRVNLPSRKCGPDPREGDCGDRDRGPDPFCQDRGDRGEEGQELLA